MLLFLWDRFTQLRLLSRQQLHPATYSANYSGLPPVLQLPSALKDTGGAAYVSLREQTPIPLEDVLLYKESGICVGHVLGLSLTFRKRGEN